MNIKIISSIVIGSLILANTVLAETKDISVEYNGSLIKFENNPIIEKGTTMVPFREIFEKFGMAIGYEPVSKIVVGKDDEFEIQLKIGETKALINGESIQIEIAPIIINGSTMVPVRFIAESTGKLVDWLPDSQRVVIKDNPEMKETGITRMAVDDAVDLVRKTCNCGYANDGGKIDPRNPENKDYSTYAEYENNDNEDNYIVAIRRKRDTVIQDWVHINPITKEMKSELGMVDNIPNKK